MKKNALIALVLFSACHPQSQQQNPMGRLGVVQESYYHKYGEEVAPSEWRDRGNHGKRILTLSNGITVAESYHFGKLDGEVTYSYPYTSLVERKEFYKEGELTAREWLSEQGFPVKREEIVSPSEKKVTEWFTTMAPRSVETYRDGRLVEGDYFTPEQEKKSTVSQGNGERIRVTSQGVTVSKEKVAGGVVIEKILFWENGSPQEITLYNERGDIDGQQKSFLQGGEPESTKEWKNGVLDGVTILFRGGEKIGEVPYKNGRKNGVERRYFDGGKIVEEVTWQNDTQMTFPKRYPARS